MPNNVVTITRYQGTQRARLHFFLQQFVQNIADRSHQYRRLWFRDQGFLDYGLLTNERGSYSLMAAAMDRITPMHQSEMSVSKRVDYRNPANRDVPRERAGRVDLWSCYDAFEYFLEFKRAFLSPRQVHGCAVPSKIKDSWRTLVNQVAEVKRGVGRNPDYAGYEDRTYFVGMQTITLRQRSKDRKTIRSAYVNQFTGTELREWAQKLSPNPGAVFAWQIAPQKHRICPIAWSEDEQETKWASFPCHLFCFTIDRN